MVVLCVDFFCSVLVCSDMKRFVLWVWVICMCLLSDRKMFVLCVRKVLILGCVLSLCVSEVVKLSVMFFL